MIHVCNPTFDLLACLSELDAISSWCFMFDTENLTPSASLKSVVLKLESIILILIIHVVGKGSAEFLGKQVLLSYSNLSITTV